MSGVTLPAEWEIATIMDINDYKSSIMQPEKNSDTVFELYSVPIFSKKEPEILKAEEIGSTKQFVKANDILVCKINPRINRVWRVPPAKDLSQIASSEWIVVRQESLNSQFLTWYFRSEEFRARLCSNVTGVGGSLTRAQPKQVEKYPVPLPPIAEQKVIADRLDKLLIQVETTKARLERIPDILQHFRQSVLTEAVSGKLTEQWRLKNPTAPIKSLVEGHNSKKRGLLKVRGKSSWNSDIDFFDLPTNWTWIENHKLAIDAGNAICAGPFGTIFKAKDFRKEGIPIIFLRHVKESGFNQKKPTFMDQQVWSELHQEYSVYGGELLVTKLGDPPGECCIYPDGIGIAMVTPDVLKMNVDDKVAHKDYLRHFFNSPASKKMLADAAFGVTRLRIDISLFKLFPIPLPPLEEQIAIVQRVEELFAFADSIKQKTNAALEQVNNLTQSILTKAFCGDLSADWRAVNPDLIRGENSAQALLAKIKSNREAQKKQPKSKRIILEKKVASSMSKQIIKVVDALKKAGEPLNGQQLLAASGYPLDGSTEDLEKFFLDIRDALTLDKSIVKLKRSNDGQDWFNLVETVSNE